MTENMPDKPVNSFPPGFIEKYRKGSCDSVEYISLDTGFLRIEYAGEEGDSLLSRVSFTAAKSKHSPAIGEVLEFSLSPDGADDVVTFIGDMNISGIQWANGEVQWGHTYEDETYPSDGKKIDLSTWIDECIVKMINPSPKILANMKKGYHVSRDIDGIKNGINSARERLWQKCSPSSAEETSLVLGLLDFAIENNDGDLIFSCCDPLKRATEGIEDILDRVTSWIEKGLPGSDYDRSEMQEILAVHADYGNGELARRWISLCRSSLDDKGVESLHIINEGSLFTAIASVPEVDSELIDFLKSVVSLVESIPQGERNGADALQCFSLMKKRIAGK